MNRLRAAGMALAFCLTSAVAAGAAAQSASATSSSKASTSRAAAQAPAKRAAPAKPPASKTAARSASSAAARKPVSQSKRSAAPPLAELDTRPVPSLRHGCMSAQAAGQIVLESGLVPAALGRGDLASPMPGLINTSAQVDATAPSPDGRESPTEPPKPPPCVKFASISVAGGGESIALLMPGAGEGAHRALVVRRGDADLRGRVSWHEITPVASLSPPLREVWVNLSALRETGAASMDTVPEPLVRETALLARAMRKATGAPDASQVRLLMSGEGDDARVVAVELFDADTGRWRDSALWMDREDGPGAFVSALGADYERALWLAPLDYQRISRGVGPGSVVLRQRVLVKPRNAKARPRHVVRQFRRSGQHIGIDFVAPTGTPVVAVADGTIALAGVQGGYGNLVIVDHGSGHTTYYAHLSAFAPDLQEGDIVRRGRVIGLVGSTGWSTGPHLHFEVRKDGRYMDPADESQRLQPWGLQAVEHERFLVKLLNLSLTRPERFQGLESAVALTAPATRIEAARAPLK